MTRVAVIVNARAGGGGDPVEPVVRALREAGAEVSVHRAEGGELTAEAERAAAVSDVVAALGGDGTVNAVAAALAGTEMPLLVLAGGTLNHFAKDLGLPLAPEEAALLVRDGVRRRVDAAEVNGRVFVNNSSIGAYPRAVALRERLQDEGVGGKWIAMSRAALRTFRRFPTLDVRIAGDDGELQLETPFVFVGNNVYGGEGMGSLERAHLDRACLGVVTAETTSRAAAVRVVLLALAGRLGSAEAVWRGEPSQLTVATPAGSLLVSLDGEVERLATPLAYRSRPGALVVLVPAV